MQKPRKLCGSVGSPPPPGGVSLLFDKSTVSETSSSSASVRSESSGMVSAKKIKAAAIVALCMSAAVASAQTPEEVRARCRAENRPCVGLVLSGGGARGFAHVGVIKVLEENKLLVEQNAQLLVTQAKQKYLEEENRNLSAELDEGVRYAEYLENELEKRKSSYEYLQRQFKTVEFNLEMEKKKSWWDKLRGR